MIVARWDTIEAMPTESRAVCARECSFPFLLPWSTKLACMRGTPASARPSNGGFAVRLQRTLAVLLLVSGAVALLAAAPMQGRGGWWDRTDPGAGRELPRSRHYAIRSDLSFEETKHFADLLDTMHREYNRLMQGLRPRGREYPTVYMFARQQDYLDTLRTRFGANATGSGGMFFIGPRGAGLAFFTDGQPRARLEHVIRHEGFHQIAHRYFDGDLPPWVNEGLAEYFGEAVVIDGTVIEGQVTPRTVERVKELIEHERVIPFAQLLSRDLRSWNAAVAGGGASTQYLQSASMVQFLLWGENGRLSSNFSAYLRNLNEGRDSVSAFRMAFGGTDDRALNDFERRWRAFAASQRAGSVRAAAERLEFMAVGLLALRDADIHPKTLEELKQALVERRFEQSLPGAHGGAVTLRADDEGAFDIPADGLQDRTRVAVFALTAKTAAATPKRSPARAPSKDRGGTSGAGGSDDTSSETAGKPSKPPPLPELSTRNLRPRDLRISWIEGADGSWTAELGLK